MRRWFSPLALSAAGVVVLLASSASAQPDRHTLENLPMPPAQGFNFDRTMNLDRWETGENWFETSMSGYGVDGGSTADPNNFAYARFKLTGRPGQIYAFSGWDYANAPIDLPSGRGDDCGHAHHVGALYWFVNAPRVQGFFLIGSHSSVGMRKDANWNELRYGDRSGTCAVTMDRSSLYPVMNQFRWVTAGYEGGFTVSVDPLYTPELILVGQSPTHGTGHCPNFECFTPVAFLMAQIQ